MHGLGSDGSRGYSCCSWLLSIVRLSPGCATAAHEPFVGSKGFTPTGWRTARISRPPVYAGKRYSRIEGKTFPVLSGLVCQSYEEARQLLSDHNNYRASWIAAGRVLAHAQELSTRVTADAHKRIVDLHRLENRRFFHDLLSTKEAGFFYGIKDPSVDIDDAAKLSSAGEERAGTTYVSTLKELPEKALHAVWEAAQWPSDYHDPLETEFSPQEKGQLLVLYPGLYKYLEHKQNFDTASGCLFPRKPKGTA